MDNTPHGIQLDRIFALPLLTGTSSAAAIQSHMADTFGIVGENGRAWRRLRMTNLARMTAARSFGTKFGNFESVPTRKPQAVGGDPERNRGSSK